MLPHQAQVRSRCHRAARLPGLAICSAFGRKEASVAIIDRSLGVAALWAAFVLGTETWRGVMAASALKDRVPVADTQPG